MPDPPPPIHAPPVEDDDPKRRVQMNVRLPHGLVTTIDLRRACVVDRERETVGITRDEWVRRALTYALLHLPPDSQPTIHNGHQRTTRSPL